MSGDKIYYADLSRARLAQFFREMADNLDGVTHRTDPRFDINLGEFEKIKIGLKKEFSGFSVKLKVKPLDKVGEWPEKTVPLSAGKTDEKKPYKKLKKQMKSTFKAIRESLLNGMLPGESVVTLFLQDSKLMMTYDKPDYGPEYYGEYGTACTAFQQAFEAKDLEACKTAWQELNRLKKDCHRIYK